MSTNVNDLPLDDDENPMMNMDAGRAMIRDKIIHCLTLYPKLSFSMLQTGIGPSVPPAIWRPILEELKTANIVKVYSMSVKNPSGRDTNPMVVALVNPPNHELRINPSA